MHNHMNIKPKIGNFALLSLSFLTLFSYHDAFANLKQFAFSKEWLSALHYEKKANRFISRVDQSQFFLSQNGKSDPLLELQKTLALLKKGQKETTTFRCRFPFRSRLLKENGFIDYKEKDCPKLQFFKSELSFAGMGVTYVSQLADNPASIMGHLFFQFSNPRSMVEGKRAFALDKTINYAATIPEGTSTFDYVVGGLTGGFQGRYTLYRYAHMLAKYNNVESRDIFRYKLKFGSKEVEKSIEHIWELIDNGGQDYYFLDENCAFQVLAILNAVKPKLDLLETTGFYASPINMLKIMAKKGLIESVEFDASLFRRLERKLFAMNSREYRDFNSYLDGEKLNVKKSPLLAEALIDAYNIELHEKMGKIEESKKRRYQRLLASRAAMGSMRPYYPEEKPISPHLSHGDTRLSFGPLSANGQLYQSFLVRPGIYDLYSRPDGYQRNSSLQFFTSRWLSLQQENKIFLKELTLFDVKKLTSYSIRPALIWDLNYKLLNRKLECPFCLTANFDNKVGFSQSFLNKKIDVFYLLAAKIDYHKGATPFYGGVGVSFGFNVQISRYMRFLSVMDAYVNPFGEHLFLDEYNILFYHGQNLDSRLQFKRERLSHVASHAESLFEVGYSF